MNLLVLGPQGSGKGTQAVLIAEAHGIPHVSTGDMFRAAIANETELGLRVKAIIESGELVPDELTTELVQERLSEPDAREGFVLDGYPRNLGQAQALATWLHANARTLDAVLYFDLDDETATQRALGRAAAAGRTDDTPEVIARRLALYHQETEPVVDFYRAAGNLVPLHAERSIDEVAAEIEAALTATAKRDA
ncbi:MAG: adenylate kinase [Gaiellales bacterium]